MHRNIKRISIVALAFASFLGQAQNDITINDVFRGTFWGRSPEAFTSMPDGIHYTMVQSVDGSRAVVKYDFASGEELGAIFTEAQLTEANGEAVNFRTYDFNADQNKVLLGANLEKIYRHSYRADYYVYDLETKKIVRIGNGKIRYPEFSPNGKNVAYVEANNLYTLNLDSGDVDQITTEGKNNERIFGATDWVYEEEFAFTRAFWWSPNSQYIAYLEFDERNVPEFSMDIYGTSLYPTQDVFKYPKAGENNSVVTAQIYDANTKTSTSVLDEVEYEYIPRLIWNPENEAIIYTLNRHQNKLELWEVDCEDNYEQELFLTDTDEAYVEISDNFQFLEDGRLLFTSERDGYNHIYIADEDGDDVDQVTDGGWDVMSMYGTDGKYVYFQAAAKDPSQKEVYRIKLNGRGMSQLSEGQGTAAATFSAGMQYYMLSFQNVNTPALYTMHEANGEQLRVLEDNAALIERMSNYNYSPKEFFSFTTSEDVDLNGWMIKPADFDATKEYPTLMFVYGGPGSQQVVNRWDAIQGMYFQYLASQGYIVACVDNRGTGARGRDFKKVTYLQLGNYETIDQIEAAKYLASLDYVDGDRIGIWGWSYGGYMSSNCITKGADVFKMAIAVAPVTNWRFYDSIYTERYMRTPQENADGYDHNAPIDHVSNIKGSFLLIHGSADDNVHVQNSMRMIEAMVQANVPFEMAIYPDKNHGIYGGMTSIHLYNKMAQFVLENL